MSMIQLPDWKDIGRRIGKKLRDIINPNPRDDGPTNEERLAQRLRDVLKGFAYFDNFDEVFEWSTKNVNPLQRANTPLLVRSLIPDQAKVKPKLLICHDYKGGYHDYEGVRPEAVPHELYSCEYLQYVDTFIYFSHKLVCIPPPSWTNAMHRNGVKILGTFMIEPQTPDIERILTVTNDKYIFAEILAEMAHTYGFDGWLLNFEKEFASNATRGVVAFIENLKRALGNDLQVVWYDSLDTDNELKYQNGLSEKNLPFAQAADGLFTNYKWTEDKLQSSKSCALEHDIDPIQICFGIDVWAQNTNMPGPRRKTYPPEGGGGTNTGYAIKKLNETGFSSAVFGPAWTFEHFSTSMAATATRSIAKAVDRSVWEGAALPDNLGCDCKKGRPHHTAYYLLNSISEHGAESPAGSQSYFDTDFSRAFGHLLQDNECLLLPTLGSQAVLPHLLPVAMPQWENASKERARRLLYGEYEAANDGSCGLPSTLLTVYSTMLGIRPPCLGEETILDDQADKDISSSHLCLFKLCMPMDMPLSIRICHARARESRSVEVGFYTAFHSFSTSEYLYEYHPLPYNASPMSEAKYEPRHNDPGSHLVELGVYCQGTIDSTDPTRLLQISRLSVLPSKVMDTAGYDFRITNLRIIEQGIAPNAQKRLAWDWLGERVAWPDSVPWSNITGPFSHFVVSANERVRGTAYCMEFPLTDKELEGGGKEISFRVEGNYFGDIAPPSVGTMLHHR